MSFYLLKNAEKGGKKGTLIFCGSAWFHIFSYSNSQVSFDFYSWLLVQIHFDFLTNILEQDDIYAWEKF